RDRHRGAPDFPRSGEAGALVGTAGHGGAGSHRIRQISGRAVASSLRTAETDRGGPIRASSRRDAAMSWARALAFNLAFFAWTAIDRKAGAGALRRMLAKARPVAAARRPIVIFPEGTRVGPGERRSYQAGVAALYQALALPLVPAAVNSGLYWGRRSFVKRPGRIVLSFLDPIPPGLPRREVRAELETRIETATAALEAEGLAAYRAGGNQSSSLLPTI